MGDTAGQKERTTLLMTWEVTLLIFATILLAMMLWTLFEWVRQLRSEIETRLQAIEEPRDTFAAKLRAVAPAPLKRVLSLGIHVDEVFWRNTLQCSAEELEELKSILRMWSKRGG